MYDFFSSLSPIIQAFIAAHFTWIITMMGAAVVFFFKDVKKNIMDLLLGFSAGIMIAASFWSLLSPAIDMAIQLEMIPWLIAAIGFLCGALFLFLGDKVYSLIETKKNFNCNNGMRRALLLVTSITLHNIPEGLVVGVAFGSVASGINGATLISAITLAIGIGLQNFPEGSAISLPLRREGFSRFKAFFLGQLSGCVEPISAVIGAILVLKVRVLLPFLLSFAAGAMIYVAISELIPESQLNKKKNLVSLFTILGFIAMMILDVALG